MHVPCRGGASNAVLSARGQPPANPCGLGSYILSNAVSRHAGRSRRSSLKEMAPGVAQRPPRFGTDAHVPSLCKMLLTASRLLVSCSFSGMMRSVWGAVMGEAMRQVGLYPPSSPVGSEDKFLDRHLCLSGR